MVRFRQALLIVALALVAHELFDNASTRTDAASCGLAAHNGTFSLFSRRVVTPQGVLSAVVHVEGGSVAALSPAPAAPAGALDYGDAVVSPVCRWRRHPPAQTPRADCLFCRAKGLVDVHTHLNEPGRCGFSARLKLLIVTSTTVRTR